MDPDLRRRMYEASEGLAASAEIARQAIESGNSAAANPALANLASIAAPEAQAHAKRVAEANLDSGRWDQATAYEFLERTTDMAAFARRVLQDIGVRPQSGPSPVQAMRSEHLDAVEGQRQVADRRREFAQATRRTFSGRVTGYDPETRTATLELVGGGTLRAQVLSPGGLDPSATNLQIAVPLGASTAAVTRRGSGNCG